MEQFRDAASSDPTKIASLIAHSVELDDSHVHGATDSPEATSPTVAASSPCHTCCRQVDYNHTGCLASTIPLQEEDKTTTFSSPSLPEQVPIVLTPVDAALLFEPFMQTSEHSTQNDQSNCTAWELDEALAVRSNSTGINGRLYGEEDQSSLEKSFYSLSKSMSLPSNNNVRAFSS